MTSHWASGAGHPSPSEKPPASREAHLENWHHPESCRGLRGHLLGPCSRAGCPWPAPAHTPMLAGPHSQDDATEGFSSHWVEACLSVTAPSGAQLNPLRVQASLGWTRGLPTVTSGARADLALLKEPTGSKAAAGHGQRESTLGHGNDPGLGLGLRSWFKSLQPLCFPW